MTNDPRDVQPRIDPIPAREFWRLVEQTRGIDARLAAGETRQTQREHDVDRRFERLEAKVEIIPTISTQLEDLKKNVTEIGTELHTYITTAGSSRRGEWSLVGQFGSLMVSMLMLLIAAGSLAIAFLHVKGGP